MDNEQSITAEAVETVTRVTCGVPTKVRDNVLPDAPEVEVGALSMRSTQGWVRYGKLWLPCALGRSGRRAIKREGDGATPIGAFTIRHVYYRPDRLQRPLTRLPISPLKPNDGWCDAVGDRNYNRKVEHPYPASAEHMWRDDHLYDVVVVLDHNECPRVQGGGSAVFMHVVRQGYRPTAGCIAFQRSHLLRLLRVLEPGTTVRIAPWMGPAQAC